MVQYNIARHGDVETNLLSMTLIESALVDRWDFFWYYQCTHRPCLGCWTVSALTRLVCVRVRTFAARGCAAACGCFNPYGTLAVEICDMCPETGVFDRTNFLGFGFQPELLGSDSSIINRGNASRIAQ